MRELPAGWEWKRLEEIAEINTRFDKNSFDDETEVTFLPMRCVEEMTGRMDTSIEKKYGEIKTGYTPIQEGDLLFAKITPCMENGKIAIAHNLKNGIGFASTEFHTLKFSPDNDTNFYRFYLMQEKIRQEAARNMTGTAGQQRVPVTFLKKLKVPVPPLPIQRQIVAVLEQAEAVKRQRQVADALTEDLLQSVFYKMFGDPVRNGRGWEVTNLGNIAIIKDVDHKMPKDVENGVLFLSPKDFKKGNEIDFENAKRISEEDYLQLCKKIKPEYGDILYTRIGTIGKVRLVPKDVKFQISYSLCIIRPTSKTIDLKFLQYLLRNPVFLEHAVNKKKSIAVPDLGLGEIEKFRVIIPPLALQQQFARVVEEVERIREQQVASGKEIERLCEGLMQRAFAGELSTGNA
jgi:type I restriction enzyme S subunit